MANWSILKAAIANIIKTNNNKEITGQILQNTLLNIISNIGENAVFAGVATPTTNPGVPDGPVFYIAAETGFYSNFPGFGRLSLNGKISIFTNNSLNEWEHTDVNIVDNTGFSSLLLTGNANVLKFNEELELEDYDEGYILRNDGTISQLEGYIVKCHAVHKNQSVIIDIQNDFNDIFAIFALYDENDVAYFIQKGKPDYTIGVSTNNVINIVKDGFLRVSSIASQPNTNAAYKNMFIDINKDEFSRYIPFYTNINLIKNTRIEPSNTLNNCLLDKEGHTFSIGADGSYSVKQYTVKEGESYIIDIQNDFDDNFAIFSLCDTSKNTYYIQKGKPDYTIGNSTNNVINIAKDGFLRVGSFILSPNDIFSYSYNTQAKNYIYSDVLWVGTSIPEGGKYPENAAKELNFTVYNKSIGSSGIIKNTGILHNGRDCIDLSETTEEKINRYSRYIGTSEYITTERINNSSYDKIIIPYIDGSIASCKLIIFDHGYNDRDAIKQEVINGEDNIDWNSVDRTTYVGAFNYILRKIYEVDPTIKVVIAGYFSSNHDVDGTNTKYVCEMQRLIAKHYSLPILDVWNVLSINDYVLPGTTINQFTQFCPDGVHPFTDTTGASIKLYSNAIIKLMKDYPGKNAGSIISPL